MELPTCFETFLKEIRPTENQQDDAKTGHETLRDRLNKAEDLAPILVSDFLQGSYRRATAVRPKGDRRADVDIVVVTNLSEKGHTPEQAMRKFVPFLERHYKGKYRWQSRSFGIELSYVDLDLVVTSAPSTEDSALLKSAAVITDADVVAAKDWFLSPAWVRMEDRRFVSAEIMKAMATAQAQPEWKLKPLRIPDRDVKQWDSTHPLEQIRWTRHKNADCNGHFVNVVKALKWWRLLDENAKPERPKGFPLERLIGECCPDGINSVAEGVTKTLESVVSKYGYMIPLKMKPLLRDYGVPEHDVFQKVSAEDFADFFGQVETAAKLARQALDHKDAVESQRLWHKLFGPKFPKPPEQTKKDEGGYTPRSEVTVPASGRFA